MAEQTFKSAGFFDFETEISLATSAASGIPLAVIGTATKGPAFTPVYFGLPTGASNAAAQLRNYTTKFGKVTADQFGPYAVKAWFEQGVAFPNRTKACQYIRVLGAGANNTSADYQNTANYGFVKNAGFKIHHPNPFDHLSGGGAGIGSSEHSVSPTQQKSNPGTVYFIAANHTISANSDVALPHFTDNDSFKGVASGGTDEVHLVRAMIFTHTASAIHIADFDSVNVATPTNGLGANVFTVAGVGSNTIKSGSISTKGTSGKFKLIVSSSDGLSFSNDDGNPGVKIYTASLDPDTDEYITKVLNTDPRKLASTGHYVYLDYPLTNAVAQVTEGIDSIALMSGSKSDSGVGLATSDGVSAALLNEYANLFGRFDTRYKTSKTPYIISQPFGRTEHDLFYFENLSDGDANCEYKISIQNLRASEDPSSPYGTFDVVLRDFYDTDLSQKVLERYSALSLDPDADNYIGKKIGDQKSVYNFDAPVEQRRFTNSGPNALKSDRIRVVVSKGVSGKIIPPSCLPFGFRGIPVLKTSPALRECSSVTSNEESTTLNAPLGDNPRLHMSLGASTTETPFTGSIIPPLPFRFKQAKSGRLYGDSGTSESPSFIGQPGDETAADGRLYWGVQFENQRNNLKPWDQGSGNVEPINGLIKSYAKYNGIAKLGTVYTGSAADVFNNNKFTLSKVALVNQLNSQGILVDITGSAAAHIKDAAYIRNGKVNGTDYTVYDRVLGKNRVTLGTLLSMNPKKFNKFAGFAKFNTIFYGGFDGLNIFDADAHKMNDRSTSTDTGGFANVNGITGGTGITGSDNGTLMGTLEDNNGVNSYKAAIDILNDKYKSIHHVLAIPGIREPLITDHASLRTEEYQMAMYIMDIPHYDEDGGRIYIEESTQPSVVQTINKFDQRQLDSSYTACYFPDVIIKDNILNDRRTEVPSSIAAITAFSFTESKQGVPWYAPAGFTRGALEVDGSPVVVNTTSRLTVLDRDELYESRINPIANFPVSNPGFVEYKIWGQKTLQQRKSALDRINVRRMVLEVKRAVLRIARQLLFRRNSPGLRQDFISRVSFQLNNIQLNKGIESFQIIMDDSNNTLRDQQNYRLNGVVKIVPTRTIEFVVIDFIIDPDGVTFQ